MHIYNVNSPVNEMIRITTATIYPTMQCNLKCGYCAHLCDSRFNKKEIYSERLTLEDFDKLVEWFHVFRHPDLNLDISVSGGEPTIDWDYFVEYTKKLRSIPGLYLNLVTNLTGEYDKEKMDFMINYYDHICVSIDGKKETNDAGRGIGSYDKLMENLPTLISRAPEKVSASMTISEDNVDQFSDNKAFLDYLGVPNSFSLDFFTPKKDRLKYASSIMQQFKIVMLKTNDDSFLDDITDHMFYCVDKTMAMTVYPTGEIIHCNIEYDKEKKLFDIRQEEHLKPFKENFAKIKTSGLHGERCKTCPALSFCKNGCYAAFTEDEDFFCSVMGGIGILVKNFKELKEGS